MRKTQLLVSALLLVLLLGACAPGAAPAAPAAPVKAAWQAEWDKVLAAARQEGKIVVQSTVSETERDVIVQGLKKFGIDAEVNLIKGGQALVKIKAERQAGLYLWDAHFGGANTIMVTAKPDGLVEYPLDPQLILPELTDPAVIKKVWYQGVFPWVDKDHSMFILALTPYPILAVNTNLVKDGDIKSYKDLLDPKWKGKMISNNPTVAGAAQGCVAALMEIMGQDFMRALTKMDLTVASDERLHMDWVAKGKMAIGLFPDDDTVAEYERVGAPIKVVIPAEGTFLQGTGDDVALWSKAPHPNAAKVFLNWMATKEHGEAYAQAVGLHSLRVDVTTAHLQPWAIRQSGMKYLNVATEEFMGRQQTVLNPLIKELFGPLIKK